MFTFSRLKCFADFFYNQEIVKMDNLNGDKKCRFRENIGTSTYYIAGIRWELQWHTSWTLAEAYWWLSACVLSWQLFIWLCLCHYQNNWNLPFSLNERFPIYNCRMTINVCILLLHLAIIYVLTISMYISCYLYCFVNK